MLTASDPEIGLVILFCSVNMLKALCISLKKLYTSKPLRRKIYVCASDSNTS